MKRYSGRFKHTLELVGGKRAASVALFCIPSPGPAGNSRGYPDEIRRKTQDVHSRKMRCSSSGARGPGTPGRTQSQDARRKMSVDLSNRK